MQLGCVVERDDLESIFGSKFTDECVNDVRRKPQFTLVSHATGDVYDKHIVHPGTVFFQFFAGGHRQHEVPILAPLLIGNKIDSGARAFGIKRDDKVPAQVPCGQFHIGSRVVFVVSVDHKVLWMGWTEDLGDRDLAFDIHRHRKAAGGLLLDRRFGGGGQRVYISGVVVIEIELLIVDDFDMLLGFGLDWKDA